MNATQAATEPKLAPPGAGIPLLERLIAKYIIFPHRFRTISPREAIENFQTESEKIVELAKALTPAQLAERRLIPRSRGLEDSSRYWSVSMAMEHLIIVGEGMRKIIFALSQESAQLPTSRIEDVKPSPDVDTATIIARFEAMTAKFVKTIEPLDFSKDTAATHVHPWFGPLNARQWLIFAAPHQHIHRGQIKEIIKRL